MHINFGSYFLTDAAGDGMDKAREEIKAIAPNRNDITPAQQKKIDAINAKYDVGTTLDDVVNHIEHAKKLVGVDHIGLGSDYDGVGSVPVGLDDVSTYPALTEALMKKGYSADDVRKINGGNLMRVWRENEKRAEQ